MDSDQNKTLIVKNIPQQYNKRMLLKQHFELYGEVTKVLVKPEKGSALIEFSNHQQAVQAKQLGTSIDGNVIQIIWKRNNLAKTFSSDGDQQTTSPPSYQSVPHPYRARSNAGVFNRVGYKPQATSSQLGKLRRPISNREERAGLYDDLPPPSDWDEAPATSSYKERKSQLTPGSLFKTARPTLSKAPTGLFGKKATAADLAAKTVIREETTISDPQTESGVRANKYKGLFGKAIQPMAQQVASLSTAGPVPSLVTKYTAAQQNYSQEPNTVTPSVFTRLSPSRPSRRSPSPTPTTQVNLPFKRSASPRPTSRRTLLPTPVTISSSRGGTDLEWIVPPDMHALMQTSATTAQERLTVLEKREKIMRQGVSRESDITKAKATEGCCPDMCPEKERYQREERRQVHIYEMVPGTEPQPQMDHTRAVKEYSRSSADQEEPLPLELRPVHVLSQTMAYLCNNILDIGTDSTWGDWYDFLWNRTRAIRKDITQQHLCSPEAAELIEKCARFHIYCGARLVEEEARVFDIKINNENLTKCLQSLKEMYADLLKKGTECRNEAEFRAYVVLMNLNEGDTLREVQQLRDVVRNSQEIRFALSAYAALNEKNYVKFFKLVKSTTVMNSFILHRYFNQIRYEALKIILRSYSSSKGHLTMSVKDLVDVLNFEDERCALAFLQHYGLNVPNASAPLMRDHLIDPDSSLQPKRSQKLVENKLQTLIGEVVYGEKLPPNVVSQPSTSFNDQGYFVGIIKPPKPREAPAEPKFVLPNLEDIPNDIVKDAVKEICLDVVNELLLPTCRDVMDDERLFIKSCGICVEELVREYVKSEGRKVAEEVITSLREELIVREKAKREAALENLTNDLSKELIEEFITSETKEISRTVYDQAKFEQYKKAEAACGEALCNDYIHTDMVSLLKDIAEDVYQTDVIERVQLLLETESRVRLLRCRSVYKQWRAVYDKRTRLRRIILSFPAAPPLPPLKRGFEVGEDLPKFSKQAKLESAPVYQDTAAVLKHSLVERKLHLALSNAPINLSKVLQPVSHTQPAGLEYVKIGLLLPGNSSAEDAKLSSWLSMKLSQAGVAKDSSNVKGDLLSSYNVSVEDSGHSHSVNVSIRAYQSTDLPAGQTCRSMYGINMMIYLLPYTAMPGHIYWQNVKQNILNFVQSKPRTPALPLLLISPLDTDKETVQYKSGMYELQDLGLITVFKVDRLYNTVQYSEQLVEGIKWLSSHRASPPDVLESDLKSFLEMELTSHFYCTVQSELAARLRQDGLHPNPVNIIELYNHIIQQLAEHLTNEQLSTFSWPVYELDIEAVEWNNRISLQQLREVILSLQLPAISSSDPLEDWRDARRIVWAYIDTVTRQFRSGHAPQLCTSIKHIISHAESVFNSKCKMRFHQPPSLHPLPCNMPWTDIITACVDYILSGVDKSNRIFFTKIGEDNIFINPDWMSDGDRYSKKGMTYTDCMQLAMRLQKADTPPDDDVVDLDLSLPDNYFYSDTRETMRKELIESRTFEKFLESAVNGDDYESENNTTVENEQGEVTSLSFNELLQDELDKSQKFEEFLRQSLREAESY